MKTISILAIAATLFSGIGSFSKAHAESADTRLDTPDTTVQQALLQRTAAGKRSNAFAYGVVLTLPSTVGSPSYAGNVTGYGSSAALVFWRQTIDGKQRLLVQVTPGTTSFFFCPGGDQFQVMQNGQDYGQALSVSKGDGISFCNDVKTPSIFLIDQWGSSIAANFDENAAFTISPANTSQSGAIAVPAAGNTSTTSGTSSVATNTSGIDCVFAWAEQTYPSLFSPAGGTTQSLPPYSYRYYSNSGSFLAQSTTDSHLYFIGPLSSGEIVDIGTVSSWQSRANCSSSTTSITITPPSPPSTTTGTTTTTTGTGHGIRPNLQWNISVTPALYTYVLQLCYSSCDGLGGSIVRDVNSSDTLTTSGFADGIRWSPSSPVQPTTLDSLMTGLNTVLATIWGGNNTPSPSQATSVLNTALANGSSPSDVAARATAGFARLGYPDTTSTNTGSTGTTTPTGSGLAGTWCAEVNSDQNCWVFDNNSGSKTGQFYQRSINQYSGTLTNTMTWSVDTTAKTLTYQFTWSTLTDSSYNYSQAVNQQAYTFPFTLSGTIFTFQGIDFYRK